MLTIGIDCAPATPRPDSYIGKVFEMLEIEKCEPVSKLFGAWTWELIVSKEKYLEKEEAIQKYMLDLYKKGRIRGAIHNYSD